MTVDEHRSKRVRVSVGGSGFSEERHAKALDLIKACKALDHDTINRLLDEETDAWVQEADSGFTCLHFAAAQNDPDLCSRLLTKGAVWEMTSHTGQTAGDVAFAFNHAEAYTVLLHEGIRAEVLKALLAKHANGDDDEHEEDAAQDNATFLRTKLKFEGDGDSEVCVDKDGNCVMHGWERSIMVKTAELLCQDHPNTDTGLTVVNIGFGLGIIDTAIQKYKPQKHIIVEAHPDVLKHMRANGWYEKAGIEIYEGRWQDWLASRDSVDDPSTLDLFDAVYYDTFSEHYRDLYALFDAVPNIMRDERSRFSFFHGLGATSRTLYDVYTAVSEMHLGDVGLQVEWIDVPVPNLGEKEWKGIKRRYWDVPSAYRCPIARLKS